MRDLAQRMHAGVGAPAPRSDTVSPENLAIASLSRPCTDAPSACTCQPTNGVPSYSSVRR